MNKKVQLMASLLFVTALSAAAAEKPAAPYVNPYMADSAYTVTHSRSDFTSLAGPTGPTRRLGADEIKWKMIGPVNGFIPLYSSPYPNGKRVIWVGGYDRVAKLDADTLEVLTTYAVGGTTYFGNDEIERHIAAMDKADDKGMLDYVTRLWVEPSPQLPTFYRMLSRENELYLARRAPDGSMSLQVFGEADATDPDSKIQFRREWKIPPEVSSAGIFGMQMTSDGHIVIVTQDGTMIALSRDFKAYDAIKLPNKSAAQEETRDFFKSFVRNSLSTDDHGGIFVVTRDNLHRVQWTGAKLSLDEADGAWSAPYPNELGWGSGTTPNLMGWGPKEDHLVVIADGTRGNNMMAFWRDQIPDDWKGLTGFDRRVAGITKVKFGIAQDEQPQIENGLVVYGYGAFIDNSNPVGHLPDLGSRMKQYLAESWYMHVPGHEPLGGTKIEWDPKARELKTAWSTQANFVSSICTISGATELLYCWGSRNREWTLEGVDWKTGKSAFHYPLGKSQRYNVYGGPIIIAPNGAVDCGCTGGLGMVRVQPKRAR